MAVASPWCCTSPWSGGWAAGTDARRTRRERRHPEAFDERDLSPISAYLFPHLHNFPTFVSLKFLFLFFRVPKITKYFDLLRA